MANRGGQPEPGDREILKQQRELQRWPAECPVCHKGPGEYCISLFSGKRVHDHKSRPVD